MLETPLQKSCQSRFLVAMWILISITGIIATAVRISVYHQTPGPFNDATQGFCDFHNGVYFPSLAFARGVSPYSQHYAETYPVARQVPPYSPLIIALHVPFAVLPLRIAEICYFAFMIACVIAMAWILVSDSVDISTSEIWTCIWPVVAFIIWSRPGHVTLFNGYFTFELVVGALFAVSYARKHPWIAACGIAIASGKPTYFLPLVVLMTARGDYAAVTRGILLAFCGGLFSMLWMTGFSIPAISQIIHDVLGGQAVHMNEPFESPVASWIRIDIAAVIAKVINRDLNELVQIGCMCFLLVVPSVVLWRNRHRYQDGGITNLSGSTIAIMSIVSIYHNSNDAILLMAPIVGWAGMRWHCPAENRWLDCAIVLLLMVPMLSPFSTFTFIQRFELNPLSYQMITSSNAVAILIGGMLILIRMNRSCDSGANKAVSQEMRPHQNGLPLVM